MRYAELVEQRPRRHPGYGAEFRDQMRLIVVAGKSGDRRPVGLTFLAPSLYRATKARQLGERLWTQANAFAEYATQVSFAHPELERDGVHAFARESVRGCKHESCTSALRPRELETFGDCAVQDCRRFEGIARVGKPIEEAARDGTAPEILERDNASGHGRRRHAQHCLSCPQVQARGHEALSATEQLSLHPLSSAQRVNVEPLLQRGPEANDEMRLGTRNGDPLLVTVALVHEQRRHSGRTRRPRRRRRNTRQARNGARVHGTIVSGRARQRNLWHADVRFFQSAQCSHCYVLQMKILVTGATGKVGSRLAKRLAQRGHQLRALVRDRTRAADLLGHGIELAQGDLLDLDSLAAAVLGVDAVVHCAAFFRGATAEQAHSVNDLGTQHLANAARAASVKRFVFTSTGLVYGPTGGRTVSEDAPCAPVDGYPLSKLAAERFLLALPDFDVRIVRLPFVYGDGDPHIAEAVPMMRGFPPAQRMSIAHHADVAQAIARVLDAVSPAHRLYNVVDDEAPDLATLFASVGEPPPDGSNAERARAFDSPMDGRRIREDLGFKPDFPRLADAIAARA